VHSLGLMMVLEMFLHQLARGQAAGNAKVDQ
jgi:hypothetical protein